jgi:hypothetical protein
MAKMSATVKRSANEKFQTGACRVGGVPVVWLKWCLHTLPLNPAIRSGQPVERKSRRRPHGVQRGGFLVLSHGKEIPNRLEKTPLLAKPALAGYRPAFDCCGVDTHFSLRSAAQAGGTVTLLFFDRNGTALTPTLVRSLSNNGGAGYNNDFLLNPANMRAISSGPLYTSGSNLAFNIPSQAVALAFNWPTLPGGYQLLILDNGGLGFSTGGTINFTYQAALDVKKKLDAAKSARPDYVPSTKFNTAYQAAASQLAAVDVYSPESAKGKAGQLALDQLAVAYDALLAEHGPVRAAANKATLTPWIGFTIDTVSNYQTNVDLAASLAAPYAWIRIVFDAGQGPSTYTSIVNYAKSKGVKVLGQPVDSTYDKGYTRAQYKQRFIDFITAFPQIDAWEVGNEVNGSWLSSDIALRIADAAAEVKTRAPGKPTFLTLFWQINTDSVPNSMFTWINANLPRRRAAISMW